VSDAGRPLSRQRHRIGPPATAGAAVDPFTSPVSGLSPFDAGCEGAPQTGTVFRNAEVEPWVDVSLADADNLVGNWQQDRWSNGGASGNLSAFSLNGGTSWTIPPISQAPDTGQAKFSRCTGGNAANGGDFERATDPWVSLSRNGVAHQVALSINDSNAGWSPASSRSRSEPTAVTSSTAPTCSPPPRQQPAAHRRRDSPAAHSGRQGRPLLGWRPGVSPRGGRLRRGTPRSSAGCRRWRRCGARRARRSRRGSPPSGPLR
jgi:hypothetical protein